MTGVSDKGSTIFEMAVEWLRGKSAQPPRTAETRHAEALPGIFNPLKLSIGGFLRIETPELVARTFSVEQLSEFTRYIAKRELKFTDYALSDPTAGTNGLWVTIRAIPKDSENLDCMLLTCRFESGYTPELAAALEGDTIVDQDSGVTYRKVGSYECSIRKVSKDGINRLSLKYWDFVNEEEPQPRFYIVEMDQSDREGWIEAYFGTRLSHQDVVPIAGHTLAA